MRRHRRRLHLGVTERPNFIGSDFTADTSRQADLLKLLYRSNRLALAAPPPCRKSPAMLAATRTTEALTESHAR